MFTYNEYMIPFSKELGNKGYIVSLVKRMPEDLSGYDQLWDFRWEHPFSNKEAAAIAAFLRSGKRVFVTGENEIYGKERNGSLEKLVKDVGGGTVSTGEPVSNKQKIRASWNTYGASVFYADPGAFAAPPGNGTFITDTGGSIGNIGTAVAWKPGTMSNADAGTLVIVLDVTFIGDCPALREGILDYMTAAPKKLFTATSAFFQNSAFDAADNRSPDTKGLAVR